MVKCMKSAKENLKIKMMESRPLSQKLSVKVGTTDHCTVIKEKNAILRNGDQE